MLKLNFISSRGDALSLVNNPLFVVTNIDGMTAAGSSISAAVTGGIDGDTVNNMQATPRTIIIDFQPRSGVNVEEFKRAVLKVAKLKQQSALVWEQNDRSVIISGLVESVEMPRFTNAVVMQVTLHCEQPFWEDIDDVIQQISEVIDLHYFTSNNFDMLYFPVEGRALSEYDTIRTKSFYNGGDVSVGLTISILAHSTVTNPIIYDENGNFFGVGYAENPLVLKEGDNVIITTHKGRKNVTLNGVNIFDKIKPLSSWLQLETGDNLYAINSDDENKSNMSFSLIYKQRYI